MIGYKRDIPERLSRSQARMGRGSTDCIKNITTWVQAHFVKPLLVRLPMIVFCYTCALQCPNLFGIWFLTLDLFYFFKLWQQSCNLSYPLGETIPRGVADHNHNISFWTPLKNFSYMLSSSFSLTVLSMGSKGGQSVAIFIVRVIMWCSWSISFQELNLNYIYLKKKKKKWQRWV